jgi:glycerol-3-phosphate dehydrogenase (NAD(P)+)
MTHIGIIGAGAWGTALGINLAQSGQRVALWGRNTSNLSTERQNAQYLPGIKFPDGLTVVQHMEALRGCEIVLLAVPAQTVRDVSGLMQQHLEPDCRIVLCAKGIERATGKLLSRLVAEKLPGSIVTVLSGPSFAREVAIGKPTAATIAGHNKQIVEALAASLSNPTLRLYHSTDIVGVELAGALKNVVAIACGIVTGRDLGENARAALMTRGLAEIARLATRLGARSETLMGLSGLGDLALTCSSLQSRNFSLGHRVGLGEPTAHITGPLAEGVDTAEAVLTLAANHDIEMPIASTVHAILSGALSIDEAIPALMLRPLRGEGG